MMKIKLERLKREPNVSRLEKYIIWNKDFIKWSKDILVEKKRISELEDIQRNYATET